MGCKGKRFAEGWHKKMWVSPSNGDPPSEWITSTVFTLPHALPNLIYGNPYDDSTTFPPSLILVCRQLIPPPAHTIRCGEVGRRTTGPRVVTPDTVQSSEADTSASPARRWQGVRLLRRGCPTAQVTPVAHGTLLADLRRRLLLDGPIHPWQARWPAWFAQHS